MKYTILSLLLLISLQIYSANSQCTGCYTGTSGPCKGDADVCFATYADGTCPPSSFLCPVINYWKSYKDSTGSCLCQKMDTDSPAYSADQASCCIDQCPSAITYCNSDGTKTNHWKKYTDSTGHCMCEFEALGDNSYGADQNSCCISGCSTADQNYCETNGTLNHWKGYTNSEGQCMCKYDETGSVDYFADQVDCCGSDCKNLNPGFCANNGTSDVCAPDWKKCDNATFCCNTNMECKDGFCAYVPLYSFPMSKNSELCGDGTKMNFNIIPDGDGLTAVEIAKIWSYATDGLTEGKAPGGITTCVEAVSTAIGECGHSQDNDYLNASSPVCGRVNSGDGGIWQITSADDTDFTLAGCKDLRDPCCNARIGYAHAVWYGGATIVPLDYCSKADPQKNCKEINEDRNNQTLWNAPWNDVEVAKKRPGHKIPFCDPKVNPWYKEFNSDFPLISQMQDQEPCYWGPFAMTGSGYYGYGKTFFPGFFGWGGFYQHYTESKRGECDPSPFGNNCNPDGAKYAQYPNYLELATEACKLVKQEMEAEGFLTK